MLWETKTGLLLTNGLDVLNNEAGHQPLVQPLDVYFCEDPDSPEVDLTQNATFTHKYTCDYNTGTILLVFPGSFLVDSHGLSFRVLSCKLTRTRGARCTLTIVTECISLTVPPDEFYVEEESFNPSLIKHIRYAGQLTSDPGAFLTSDDLRAAVFTASLPTEQGQTEAISSGNPYAANEDAFRHDLWAELVKKLIAGEDSFYLAGLRVTYIFYSWAPVVLDPGGYIQSPYVVVPSEFLFDANNKPALPPADAADANSTTQGYSATFWSYLRLLDKVERQRTWYKITHTWIGGPQGHWDAKLYSKASDPFIQPDVSD